MNVLIYGAGMLGCQIAHLISNHLNDHYSILGFVDDLQSPGTLVFGKLKVIDSLARIGEVESYRPDKIRLAFGIGYSDMTARRLAYESAKSHNYKFETLIHPNASVEASADLGEGVVVLAGAVVDQFVTLGNISYLHNGSIVGENSILGANNYLSAGTTFGGSVEAGDNNFFGINSTIVNDTVIGSNNFVNAGSLIYKPVGDNCRIVEFREQREVSIK